MAAKVAQVTIVQSADTKDLMPGMVIAVIYGTAKGLEPVLLSAVVQAEKYSTGRSLVKTCTGQGTGWRPYAVEPGNRRLRDGYALLPRCGLGCGLKAALGQNFFHSTRCNRVSVAILARLLVVDEQYAVCAPWLVEQVHIPDHFITTCFKSLESLRIIPAAKLFEIADLSRRSFVFL